MVVTVKLKNHTLAHKPIKMLMLIAKLLAILSAYIIHSDTSIPPIVWKAIVSHTTGL